jgi:hypothetical protein
VGAKEFVGHAAGPDCANPSVEEDALELKFDAKELPDLFESIVNTLVTELWRSRDPGAGRPSCGSPHVLDSHQS